MHTEIRALSGIRTHSPSVPAGEDGSCFRLRGRWYSVAVNYSYITQKYNKPERVIDALSDLY
jgi:hypothetical protein